MSRLSKQSVFAVLVLMILLSMLLWAESPPPKSDWDIAVGKLQKHVAPIIEKIQNHKYSKDKEVSLIRFQSKLLEKHLPQYRLYVIDSSIISTDRIFLLQEDGTFFNLGHGDWTSIDEAGTLFHSPKICNFLVAQKFRLDSEEAAIDMAKLLEEISYAPNEVIFLRTNTKNYTVYKKDFLRHVFSSHLNWEYFSEKTKTGYKASRRYIGPEASIMAPQIFYLEVDEKNEVAKITAK